MENIKDKVIIITGAGSG